MAFMTPEYRNDPFYEVETTAGGWLVPADLVGDDPALEDFEDYVEGEPESFTKVEGWFVRLSASGFMDATEWSGPHETEEEVREHVKEHWEVDPDTGDDLEE